MVSFYHAIHATRLDQMPSKKEKRPCTFLSAMAREKKPKKLLSSDWAENLAESDKGSYFDQEKWSKELNKQPSAQCDPSVSRSTFSANRSKITVEELLADMESEKTETWQKLHGHVIAASERLQEKINELVTCQFGKESLNLWKICKGKTDLVPLGCLSARMKAVCQTKLIFHFGQWKKISCMGSWLSSYQWQPHGSLKGF